MAMLELYTRHAVNGEQLLGPYSRFGWNHPGPAYFYILVPLYWFSGESASSLYLTARIINLLFAVGLTLTIVIVLRKSDPVLAGWSMVLLAAYYCRLGPQILANPWNPWIVIVPFALLTYCLASLSAGHLICLPLAVFLVSFLVQTHVGLTPCTLALVVTSLGLLVVFSKQGHLPGNRLSFRAALPAIVISVVIFAIMWVLPALEEIRHSPGNLYKLLVFFTGSGKGTSLFDGFPTLARQLAWPPLLLIKWLPVPVPAFEYDLLAQVFTIAQAAATPFLFRAAIRRGLHVRAALAGLGAVGILAAILSVLRIEGDIFPYLIAWTSVIGLLNWAVLGSVCIEYVAGKIDARDTRGRIGTLIAPLAAVIVVTGMAVHYVPVFINESVRPPTDSVKVRKLSRAFMDYLAANDVQRPLIYFNWSHWSVQSGVIVQLSKSGQDFAVKNTWPKHSKQWPLLFGDAYDPTGNEECTIIFGSKRLQVNPAFTCIAEHGGTCIYVVKGNNAAGPKERNVR